MSDPLWNERASLTDGWAAQTAPAFTWTAYGALSDGWVERSGAFGGGSLLGDDDFYLIGDDGEYIQED